MRILKQVEGGMSVTNLCLEYRTSIASFYKWRSKSRKISCDNESENISGTLKVGQRSEVSSLITSSQESHSRMPTWNATTELFVMNSWR